MHGSRSRRGFQSYLSLVVPTSLCFAFVVSSSAQTQTLHLDFTPADTSVKFTIGDTVHTIHGSFRLKQGSVDYSVANAAISGSLTIDATSGQSGNRIRDRKMHREILESGRYPEIIFRPDRVDGRVAPAGSSTVQVHGIFSLHGADHEISMPMEVQLFPDHWTADTHFIIPYVRWGLKNPSNFLLRVSESVEINVHASGTNSSSASGH